MSKKKKKNNQTKQEESLKNKVSFISSEKIKNICFKCLQEKDTIRIPINPLGYDSFFDNLGTEIHLCQDCIDSCLDPSIWDISSGTLNVVKKQTTTNNGNFANKVCSDGTFTENLYYSHEDEIVDYINQLPIQSQELVFNRFSWGSSVIPMKPQDWIDYQQGILPHDKTKEYGLISLDELKAYHQRFPICKWVKIVTELDKPIYSICTFNCKGDENGNPLDINNSPSCFDCPFFQEKNQDEQVKFIDVNSLQRKTIVFDALSQLSELSSLSE